MLNLIGGALTAGKQNESLNFLVSLYYNSGKMEHSLLAVGKGVISIYFLSVSFYENML